MMLICENEFFLTFLGYFYVITMSLKLIFAVGPDIIRAIRLIKCCRRDKKVKLDFEYGVLFPPD